MLLGQRSFPLILRRRRLFRRRLEGCDLGMTLSQPEPSQRLEARASFQLLMQTSIIAHDLSISMPVKSHEESITSLQGDGGDRYFRETGRLRSPVAPERRALALSC